MSESYQRAYMPLSGSRFLLNRTSKVKNITTPGVKCSGVKIKFFGPARSEIRGHLISHHSADVDLRVVRTDSRDCPEEDNINSVFACAAR